MRTPTPLSAPTTSAAAAAAANRNHAKATKPTSSVPWWACRAAFWCLAGLSLIAALAVNVLVTPGRDWLRHNGGESIGWFRVGGGGEEIFGECNVGLLSSQWCSYFAIFTVVQTTASMNVSIAAVLLLVATCCSRPYRWKNCSGTFLMVYAVLQGAAVGLVVAIGRKLEDATEEVDLISSGASSGRIEPPPSSSSSTAATSSIIPTEIEYGMTLVVAFCCAVVCFNASLILFALPREPPPGAAGAPCDCLCRRKRRRVGERRVGVASRVGTRAGSRSESRRPSGFVSPAVSGTGSVFGSAAGVFWTPRPVPSAPTFPRAGSATGSGAAC